MAKKNPHIGSSFERWLDEEGIREEVTAAAVLTDAERAAIADARSGDFASDQDIAAFWTRHGRPKDSPGSG